MTNEDPVAPIRALGTKVVEALAALGLTVRQFGLHPSFDGSPDHVQILGTIEIEQLLKDPEARKIDAEFEALTQGLAEQMKQEALEERRAKALESLRKMEGGNGGFLK